MDELDGGAAGDLLWMGGMEMGKVRERNTALPGAGGGVREPARLVRQAVP